MSGRPTLPRTAWRCALGAWALSATAGCAQPADTDDLVAIAPSSWGVTRGALVADGRGASGVVSDPTFRGVVPNSDGNAAELRFAYLGASAQTALLASGELRRQVGLKLRAQDGCNLLYVIWRIEPSDGLVVSLKRNPGARNHDECGADGYVELPAAFAAALPLVEIGAEHWIRARLAGQTLSVWVDERIAWQGDVGADALARSTGPWAHVATTADSSWSCARARLPSERISHWICGCRTTSAPRGLE